MRQDYFTFRPKFKLLIAGNTKPLLSRVDEAMRRRFHIVPMTVQIPKKDRDRNLKKSLEGEWPGILAWAIDGHLQYKKVGLIAPLSVTEATDNYLEAQDVFSTWLDVCCKAGPELWDTPKRVFDSWKSFAISCNERVGRQADFIERMEVAGFNRCRNRNHRQWLGIVVIQPEGSHK